MSATREGTDVPLLYIWLWQSPLAAPPDVAIEDTPGVSDLQLVAFAIAEGRLGAYLPAKLAISEHERPNPGGFRAVEVGRLLRDYGIRHRRCFEILRDHGSPAGQ